MVDTNYLLAKSAGGNKQLLALLIGLILLNLGMHHWMQSTLERYATRLYMLKKRQAWFDKNANTEVIPEPIGDTRAILTKQNDFFTVLVALSKKQPLDFCFLGLNFLHGRWKINLRTSGLTAIDDFLNHTGLHISKVKRAKYGLDIVAISE